MKVPLPPRIKDSIEVLLGSKRAVPAHPVADAHAPSFRCPVCASTVHAFRPLSEYYYDKFDEHGYIHSIFLAETINRKAYSCPTCGASDRDRLYALYIQKEGFLDSGQSRILDIAPSRALSRYIRSSFPHALYRTADFLVEGVDDKVDITDMHIYADGAFDFLICSHVLEHVEDDRKAMSELYRILSDRGRAIVMVPINLGLVEDYENPEITTPEGRWKHFGQDDHVRVYSKAGFTNKLQSAGFAVREHGSDYFGPGVFEQNGIHPRSVLYVVAKA